MISSLNRIYTRVRFQSCIKISLSNGNLIQSRFVSEHSWAAERLRKQGEMLAPDESWQKKPTIKINTPDDLINSADDKIRSLAEQVLNLNIVELSQLAFIVQRRTGMPEHLLFGDMTPPHLKKAAPSSSPSPQASADAAKEAEAKKKSDEEAAAKKSEPPKKLMFSIRLKSYEDTSKVKVIKEVRAASGLGLKEAKELVEGCPKVFKTGVGKEEADAIKEKVTAAGGVVEIE